MKIGKVMKKLPERFIIRASRGQYDSLYKSLESLSEGEYLPVELGADQSVQTFRTRIYNLNKKADHRSYRSMIDPENEFVIVVWWISK